MHPAFADLLRCPQSGAPLRLEVQALGPAGQVVRGSLTSPTGTVYPIVRGVPRFIGTRAYAATFGYQWSLWPRVQFESENAGGPLEGYTTSMWERIVGPHAGAVQGRRIVDFGCGPGRFLEVVRRKGGIAVGIDATSAVDAARRNFEGDPRVLIVQGDILNPPFPEGAFDGGFSIGVLHHTPAPLQGLRKLVRTVREGGWVACSVYSKGSFYDLPSVTQFRTVLGRLFPSWRCWPALAYSWLSARLLSPLAARARRRKALARWVHYAETHWMVCLHLADPRWTLLDIFDAITPAIATTHSRQELAAWMERAGCVDLRFTDWGETSAVGVRSARPEAS